MPRGRDFPEELSGDLIVSCDLYLQELLVVARSCRAIQKIADEEPTSQTNIGPV